MNIFQISDTAAGSFATSHHMDACGREQGDAADPESFATGSVNARPDRTATDLTQTAGQFGDIFFPGVENVSRSIISLSWRSHFWPAASNRRTSPSSFTACLFCSLDSVCILPIATSNLAIEGLSQVIPGAFTAVNTRRGPIARANFSTARILSRNGTYMAPARPGRQLSLDRCLTQADTRIRSATLQ